ncbi:uncharacterized protein LY79DRAFT_513652 [Colletotrichum navitas]|uniref:Uncharacterized protein n=1 Tax=Colletotrichum navitas TaxID=681940 RepID=A0AAD8Q0V1_9PEZI|nr:uncharacterized protein LY79DRAFT_513652 [Colletotrichum navitas]KAK1593782.1 hypothetical protein LY79DRAFT_513652 [Colletotrichum navitas]
MALEPFHDPWWLPTQLPELDADDGDFCDYTPLPKPGTSQLDMLFWAESIQLLRFGGLRAHESRILQEVEPYTPRPAMPEGLSGYGSADSSENEEDTSGASTSGDDSDDYSIDDEQGGASLFPTHKMPTVTPRPWMERDFVEVDETKWFKIFRRERWASYSNPNPKQLSVDIGNDKDWTKLSRVIEIANRILSEAVDQEW